MSDHSKRIVDLSPEQLELLVLQASKKRKERPHTRIPPQPRSSNIFPMSFAQQRLWFIDQLAPGTAAYNMPTVVRLTGPLDEAALQQSIDAIFRRHEALRTTFTLVDGRPVQVIAPAGATTAPMTMMDISGRPSEEREIRVQQIASAEAQRPFDLAHDLLTRVTLVRLGETEHLLLLIMHHIVSDVWSTAIFIQEIMAHYVAYTSGRPAAVPDLPIQYADYAVWQRDWLQGKVLEEQIAYWKGQLAGLPVLQLPTNRPRPPVTSFRGALRAFSLPASLSEGLKVLNQQEGATLFMTLLAAFQTLLYRYSAQEDIVVSTGVANRNRSEIEPLIGCFINILVMRTHFSGNPAFRVLLGQVREMCLGAYAHQDLPFEVLVEQLQPDRDLSYNPLAQVMFVLQTAAVEVDEFQDLKMSPVPLERSSAQFDLTLHIWDRADGLIGSLEYNTDLFDAAMIDRMLKHFQVLLKGIVATPDQPVAALPLLTEPEWHQFAEWNATEADFPRDLCLHHLFEAQVRRDPEALALIYRDQRLTYGTLNQRANQLAHHLRSLDVGPEVLVGICTERSIEMVVGILGILKAGGAYVPLDPLYPPERLAFMLADAQAPVLLTQAVLLGRLPGANSWTQSNANLPPQAVGYKPTVICLDTGWPTIAHESAANVESGATAENLGYVIYTSGSTGRPKGIAIQHRGIVNNLVDLNRSFDIGPTDRVIALSSLSFDMCVYEVLGTLEAGAAIVMPEPDLARDPVHWADLVMQHSITVWNSAPPLLKLLVEYVTERPEVHPQSLRVAILGGDWVPVTLPDQFKALAPSVQVIVLGGATEASIHSTIYPVEVSNPGWTSIPYGKPMRNQRSYVLDARFQPVPVGVAGELYLGGVGLARGYYNRPELTAEKFIPNPFAGDKETGSAAEPQSSVLSPQSLRLYRTGDLVRYLPDGTLELLGRIDFRVKIRGLRIELEEINVALERHPAVREALVIAREDTPGDQRLVAYIVPTNHQPPTTNHQPPTNAGEPDKGTSGQGEDDRSILLVSMSPGLHVSRSSFVEELRDYLRNQLPSYMVPSAFVLREALPLSPNGKVDRRALPAPAAGRPDLEKGFIAPRTPEEAALAQIWSEILVLDQVGIHDNFFELGGHSLLAIQVLARVRDLYQAELTLINLYEAPTIAELAMEIVQRQAGQTDHQALEHILAEIEHISDEDVQTLLEAEPQEEDLEQILATLEQMPEAELNKLLAEDDAGEHVGPQSLEQILVDLEGLSDDEIQALLGATETR